MTDRTLDSSSISWRAVIYGTPVLAADGQAAGVVREVLGSDAEDVFHGVRVGLNGGAPDVLLSSGLITDLTIAAVQTSLPASAIAGLPAYVDEATYHLASVGWLRKHVAWAQDAHKDEEPG
jgi:hypothetical protein